MSNLESIDSNPPGSSVHEILQAKSTGVDCHFRLQGRCQFLHSEVVCWSMFVFCATAWVAFCWNYFHVLLLSSVLWILSRLTLGKSLAVQWLGLLISTAGAQVPSLVGELRSHHGKREKKKKKTNSVKQVLAGNIKTKSLIQYWTQGDNTSVVQFVTQSCPALCDPMDYSTPGFPVHHQFLELTQTHVHRIRDAIQPSHLFSSPSPPTLSLAHHQGLFQWVSSSHQVAKILAFQL